MADTIVQGYAGKQLRIDLDRWESREEPLDAAAQRLYIGGAGYGARLLYDELPKGVDPLGPDNIMVLATGPLSLSQVPGGGSIVLCFKSPLTGIWGESRVGGDSGPELKKAGFDYVIVKGRSSKPVWMWIHDGKCEFRDASHLLGLTVPDKTDALRKEVGEPKAAVLCIGPAGEHLVKISSVMSDDRAAGRCGGGAVWGAKNLIAIVIKGSQRVEAADPAGFKSVVKKTHDEIKHIPGFLGLQSGGTIGDIPSNDDGGDWPTKNWSSNSWGKGLELHEHYLAKNFIKGFACYRGCTIACARWIGVKEGPFQTPEHGGAEYESISCFTAYVMSENMDAAVHCTYLCNVLGLDTISTGALIAFAMECYEKGLLSDIDMDGLDLRWGNAEILPVMVKKIAYREGLGDVLAEGVRLASRKIGRGAEDFAVHVKGLEGPAHDPRSGKALAITYATGNRGMCHIHPLEGMAWDRGKLDWGMIKYGVRDPNDVERWDEKGKGRDVALLQDGLALPEVLGTCKFYMYGGVTVDHWAEMVSALTGWPIDGRELLKISERVINLQRLFNAREGITRQDDQVPARVRALPSFGKYSTEPECEVVDLDGMLSEYYQHRGWDPETGIPTPEKLSELGLSIQ